MNKRQKVDNIAKAKAAWGDDAPEWVITLAEACNHETQAAVGRRIGYSPAVVSSVLSNSYGLGDIARVEGVVRGALMAETVVCPVMNTEIGRDVCHGWQKRPFSTASANAVRMYQGCRSGCPNSRIPANDRRGETDAF